jgi:hypothetical protein
LRGFEYSEEINNPPSDQDRVDWFLFDEQRGYCDYYSSSFVVLARSLGIPARMAAGYSAGEYVEEAGAYRQHEYDAHTWPEVFFPGHGWIEFEPTAGDAPLGRPRTMADLGDQVREPPLGRGDQFEDMLPDDEMGHAIEMPEGEAAATTSALMSREWLLGTAGLVALLAAALTMAFAAWQHPLRGLSAAESAFARMARVAKWLGIPLRDTDTPNEYGDRLAGAIPEGGVDIATIVDAYVSERFGKRESAGRAQRLAAAWGALRGTLPRAAGRLGLSRLRRAEPDSEHSAKAK